MRDLATRRRSIPRLGGLAILDLLPSAGIQIDGLMDFGSDW